MTEWWTDWATYRPSDFLMFSPRVYWRLFESINHAWWPAHIVLVGAPLGWIVHRALSQTRAQLALPALFLGACWGFVAWAFLYQRFAPINWVADAYAVAFAAGAFGLLVMAAVAKLQGDRSATRSRFAIGFGLWALLLHPLLSVLAGRSWRQAEVFGLAPDPTVIATLGLLLIIKDEPGMARWLRWSLWSIAVAWCLISATTLATMESVQAAVPLAAVLLALIASRAKG